MSFPLDRIRARPQSLWRYAEALPFPLDAEAPRRVTMGEGWTPLVSVTLGNHAALAKLEFLSPTLSFKDRGAVVLVATALQAGATQVITDSSGNAGTAVAAYAARAGLRCIVFAPATAPAPKLAAMRAHGADLRLVDGSRADVAAAARMAIESTGAFDASHVRNPVFIEGTKTVAFEVWEQMGAAPDAALGTVVVPVGNGSLLLGVLRGFAELVAAGALSSAPTVVAVQLSACAPLAAAFAAGDDEPAKVTPAPTAADGVAIAEPALGRDILAAVRRAGARIVSVGETAIADARRQLAAQGLYVEPSGAVAPAAITTGLAGVGPFLVPLTGAGLKAP